jgi:hypothetical protein
LAPRRSTVDARYGGRPSLLRHRTEAREQLRRQVGTLRFDLQTLATTKTVKEEKKKALELRKAFIQSVRAALVRMGWQRADVYVVPRSMVRSTGPALKFWLYCSWPARAG